MHRWPLVDGHDALWRRGSVAQGAVGADGIVVASPPLDQDLSLAERIEQLPVEQLVAEPGVKALAVAVFPGVRRVRN